MVEIVNSVGAGDAFMSGFLSAWLRDRPIKDCVRTGNANGALVVSRHGCTPAMPVRQELESFMARGGVLRPNQDEEIERLHRAQTRRPTPARLCVLAIDHRWQLEALADQAVSSPDRLPQLKGLLADAFLAVANERDDCGILVDEQYGASVLEQMAGGRYWTARAVDVPRSRPLELLAGQEVRAWLHSRPADQVVKVICYAHPQDAADLQSAQIGTLLRLARACRAEHRELLVELQSPDQLTYGRGELATLVSHLYRAGIRPEWWKLPALPRSPCLGGNRGDNRKRRSLLQRRAGARFHREPGRAHVVVLRAGDGAVCSRVRRRSGDFRRCRIRVAEWRPNGCGPCCRRGLRLPGNHRGLDRARRRCRLGGCAKEVTRMPGPSVRQPSVRQPSVRQPSVGDRQVPCCPALR